MRVGDVVEDIAGNWTVNATEQEVAIQGTEVAVTVVHGQRKTVYVDASGCSVPLQAMRSDIDFESPDVSVCSVEQTIQVVFLNAIGVNQCDLCDAHSHD